MKPSTYTFLAVAIATLVQASPTALQSTHPKRCTPVSGGKESHDDTPAIVAALQDCGNGGIINIPTHSTFMIRSVLDFTSCVGCDFQIEGTLMASDDLDYWQGRPAIISIAGIKNARIRSLTGRGLVDGNGQAAWDRFANDSSYRRPTLFSVSGSSDIGISNLDFINAPNVFHSVNKNSQNIAYSHIRLSAISKSANLPKNTDGFDIGPASNVLLTNIDVTNNDDCVAFKPGANYVTVDTIKCTGSHGLSVGSLGGGRGSSDIVQNIYVRNADMVSSTKAAGIKLYPSGPSHGTSTVSNVTWDGVKVSNCDYGFQVQSCYGETSDYCSSYPSTAKLSGIVVKNFFGTTSGHYSPVVANINCPQNGTCGLSVQDFNVRSPTGTVLCDNVPGSVGFDCTDGASG